MRQRHPHPAARATAAACPRTVQGLVMGELRGGAVGLIASHSSDLSRRSQPSRGPCEGRASASPVSPAIGYLARGSYEAQQSANGITAWLFSSSWVPGHALARLSCWTGRG